MDLEEGDVASLLSVRIRKHLGTTTSIELVQTGLIQRNVDDFQISHFPSKRTPATLAC
jgi:hypothetical protein